MQTPESNTQTRAFKQMDWFVGAALFVFTLLIYLRTLAPSVAYMFDDSLEFQLLASRMAIAHPTGYPLYSLLLKLATFLPFGDVAYRANLISAWSAAGAVVFTYLAARLITARFFTPNNVVGEILTRVPALLGALILAFGETFWSQAVLAEVYALQALLTAVMLWLVLHWGSEKRETRSEKRKARSESIGVSPRSSLLIIAFFAGLLLTHHRMSVLLIPAIAVYVLTIDRAFLKQPLMLLKIVAVFALPLLLYLYLPIRGMVTSSLDGAYSNTPEGFLNWVLGTAYTVFVTQNPFHQTRDAAYYLALFVNDFGALGLLAAVGGFIALFLRAWREWLLLTLALLANLIFVFTYRVADINVFFIPTFVLVALLIAAGLAGLLWFAYYALTPRWAMMASSVGAIVLLLLPFALLRGHYARVDLSNKRDVIEYGRAVLSQPLPQNATVIGILGEMSLLRYLQENENLRADVETIAADKEEERFKAIDAALERKRAVFLTRPLSGIEKRASLTSVGPLIQVQPRPNRGTPPEPLHVLNENFGDVKLLGYTREQDSERAVRVTLFWQPQKKINDARLVSLKLLDASGNVGGQLDRQPVLDAYPTNAWRNNEYVADDYALPIFVGALPGEYTLQVTMYDPNSGKVFGQRDLERVTIPLQTQNVPRELLGVNQIVLRDLGGVELSGYDLETSEPFAAGAQIPLTLLWRVWQNENPREFEIIVADEFGKIITHEGSNVSGLAGQYVRQNMTLTLPNPLAAGRYFVRVNVRGGLQLPFQENTVTLGMLQVQAQ